MRPHREGNTRTAPDTDQIAVTARTQQGRVCTLAVERVGPNTGLLRYDGSERVTAELTPEVIEQLFVGLSVHGRTAIPARSPAGGACTLLTIGQHDGARMYFHAATAFGAVLDRDAVDDLRTAVERLRVQWEC